MSSLIAKTDAPGSVSGPDASLGGSNTGKTSSSPPPQQDTAQIKTVCERTSPIVCAICSHSTPEKAHAQMRDDIVRTIGFRRAHADPLGVGRRWAVTGSAHRLAVAQRQPCRVPAPTRPSPAASHRARSDRWSARRPGQLPTGAARPPRAFCVALCPTVRAPYAPDPCFVPARGRLASPRSAARRRPPRGSPLGRSPAP